MLIGQIKKQARASLKGRWGFAIIVALLNGIIVSIIPELIRAPFDKDSSMKALGVVFSLIISGPMALGFALVYLHIVRDEAATVGDSFSGFQRFGKAFLTNLLMGIYLIGWTAINGSYFC
ncbi:DUF975 family protein [Bacillus sp. 165]|uniref:DUF975 family protein n=1 Tax=Bacillus sp. 165 TaxID=1529117 RepID=UPI001ADB25FC|nr:DUF975 family protein [Bacillus sp. 165]MBO9130059.1 DUF975 family protein [Bacillus sp. 165]